MCPVRSTGTLDAVVESAVRPAPAGPRHPWLPAVVLLLGVGVGVGTEWALGVLDDPWAMWANSVAAWCLPAAVVGALAGGTRSATVAAVATEVLLVASYYAARSLQSLPVEASRWPAERRVRRLVTAGPRAVVSA